MIPVTFDNCAGLLHPAKGASLGRGVVICESFGFEAMCNRRSFMALAEMLAAAGMPTLRFHFPGTGDSKGDEDEGQIEDAIESINAARAYLKAVTGVSEVALFGVRLGGLLAIEAGRRAGDVPALALLAPALFGRLYARELMLQGAMVENQGAVAESGWAEYLGFRIHKADLARLRALDARATAGAGAAERVLLLSQEEPLPEAPASVEVRAFPHFEGFAQPTEYVYAPTRTFAEIVSWLREGAPETCGAPARSPAAPILTLDDGSTEEAVQFGPVGQCFGILTRPAPAAAGRSGRAVLILNTGMNHHVGNGRGNVRLARRLARAGVTALRMDMRKLGDSLPVDPTDRAGFHDLGRIDDVKAALDILEAEGHSEVLLSGICAGAYIGLHAAAADPRIVAATLVNLPYFYMRDEDPRVPLLLRPTALWQGARKAFGHLARGGRAPDPATWPEPDKNYYQRLRLTSWGLRFVHYGTLWASEHLLRAVRFVLPRHWAIGGTDRMFRRLSELGVDVNLVYGGKDWGLHELAFVFGKAGRRLVERGWARVTIIEEVDHPITTSAMQAIVARVIEDDLGILPEAAAPVFGAYRLVPDGSQSTTDEVSEAAQPAPAASRRIGL